MIKKALGWLFILFLIAMAIPASRARVGDAIRPAVDDFKARFVPRRLESMADQLEARLGRGGQMPAGGMWEGWLRRDFTSSPQDPWDNTYYLEVVRGGFIVGSAGPDGIQGNDDDITEQRAFQR